MIICLDAGHFLNTPGKRCLKSIDPNETREWVLNDRIARKVQSNLSKYDCIVMRVDDTTGKKEVTLHERVTAANKANATCYVSIHHNAGILGGDGGGIVVYAHPQTDSFTREFQKTVYDHLIATTNLSGNRSNPCALSDLYVLRNTVMTAVLCECGFMDSTVDTPIILTDDFAAKAAKGIAEALIETYNIPLKNITNPPTQNGDSEYMKWKTCMDRYLNEQAELPVSPWAEEGFANATGHGIVDGTRPQSCAKREEVALMIEAAIRGTKG